MTGQRLTAVGDTIKISFAPVEGQVESDRHPEIAGLFTLSAGIGFWPAAILSAAYFGYAHHGNSGEDWVGLFNAAAFGLLACFLLRRTGNLSMPIGLHLAFDWGERYFYGVADSGQTLPGHLLNSSSSGPAWLSGGTVGPEGSLLCTLLIVLVWLICAAWLREVKYPKLARIQNSRGSLRRFHSSSFPVHAGISSRFHPSHTQNHTPSNISPR